MTKLCTCLLLSIIPVPGFTAVHTNAHHAFEVMDHLPPAVILEQGGRDNTNNGFLNTICSVQPPLLPGASGDAYVEGHERTIEAGWLEGHQPGMLLGELAKPYALKRMDGEGNIATGMSSGLVIDQTPTLPSVPALAIGTAVHSAACMATFVH